MNIRVIVGVFLLLVGVVLWTLKRKRVISSDGLGTANDIGGIVATIVAVILLMFPIFNDGSSPTSVETPQPTVAELDSAIVVQVEESLTEADAPYFLRVEERLRVGKTLRSANGRFVLFLQNDGNLALYDEGENLLWASNTLGENTKDLVMQEDGNLVLYAESGVPLWASGTKSDKFDQNYICQLNDDGSLVIYLNGTVIWTLNTGR